MLSIYEHNSNSNSNSMYSHTLLAMCCKCSHVLTKNILFKQTQEFFKLLFHINIHVIITPVTAKASLSLHEVLPTPIPEKYTWKETAEKSSFLSLEYEYCDLFMNTKNAKKTISYKLNSRNGYFVQPIVIN